MARHAAVRWKPTAIWPDGFRLAEFGVWRERCSADQSRSGISLRQLSLSHIKSGILMVQSARVVWQTMRPAVSAAPDICASLFNDKGVHVLLWVAHVREQHVTRQ
jgi:hypothetical protein